MGKRLVVDLENPVVDSESLRNGRADFAVAWQNPDAVVIVTEFEFAFRANHAARLDATDLRLLDLEVTGKHRAHGCDRDVLTSVHVRCAANDLHRFVFANVDLAQ